MALIPGLIPVFVAKKGTKFPESGNFFVIAANGAFVHKDDIYWEGLVPMPLKDVPGAVKVNYCIQTLNGGVLYLRSEEVTTTSFWKKDEDDEFTALDPTTGTIAGGDDKLLSVEPYINANLRKYDQEIIYKALLFFRAVYNKHHAEAIVLPCYRESDQSYILFCPKQKVSSAHLDYDRAFARRLDNVRDNEDPEWVELLKAGYVAVGTIHSHCNFQAFHSGCDTGDEASFNGVHITLGHVVDQNFSVASSLSLNNWREEVDIENIALGVKRVGDAKTAQSAYISSGRQNFYQIDLPADRKQQLKAQFEKEIEENWMTKVEHQTFFQSGCNQYGGYCGPSYGGSAYAGSGFDDYEGIPPGGESYILVNGVWVKESEVDDTDVLVADEEDEAHSDIWDRDEDKDKDIPDFEDWAEQQKNFKTEKKKGSVESVDDLPPKRETE